MKVTKSVQLCRFQKYKISGEKNRLQMTFANLLEVKMLFQKFQATGFLGETHQKRFRLMVWTSVMYVRSFVTG